VFVKWGISKRREGRGMGEIGGRLLLPIIWASTLGLIKWIPLLGGI